MTDVIVLCYHALSPTWETALSTTPERFERQIATLVKRRYRGVTFTEAVGATSRERVMAVTFDDAYRSVFELGWPILRRYGVPATVFAPTDFIDSTEPMCWAGIERWLGGPHEHELMPMTWQELQELAEAGWEIGAHTGSHANLTEIDDDALKDELTRSKAACERHLGRSCTSMAYPYGEVNEEVVTATASAGYAVAATLPHRLNSHDRLQWPRIGIYWADGDRSFRLKVSPAIRRLRRWSAWNHLYGLSRIGRT
jgi:peptidoglycan/xylan/chitin deacetylase (PgdA/CDA1 family)